MIKNELLKRILTSLVLLPILVFSILYGKFYFGCILFIVFFIASYEWYFINKKSYAVLFSGFFIILASIFSAYFLNGDSFESKMLFLWILSISFFSDIGGYTFGKMLGGKKLTKISPNKTISGMYGSFIFSIFPIIGIYILEQSGLTDFEKLIFSIKTIILSLVFSLICQLGDIIVSYFKRKNNIKDTGNILPGHGGLLDRIDGLIFLLIFSAILKIFKLI